VNDATPTSESLLDALVEITASLRAEGFVFRLNGFAARAVLTGRDLQASTARITPALVVLIGAVLFVASRSASQVLVSLATMGVALVWTQGLMGWLAWAQDGIHQVLAPLIMIVGVCDAIHLLVRASECEGSAEARMLQASREVGAPCLVTTATTAVALGSFTLSGLSSFVRFGLISAFGVSVCLLLTFTLLPLIGVALSRSTFAGAGEFRDWPFSIESIVDVGRRRYRSILAGTALLLSFGGAGWMLHLRVDTNWVQVFGEDTKVTNWIHFFSTEFGASDSIEIMLELPPERRFDEPEVLSVLDRLGERLESIDGLGRASSVKHILERVEQALYPTSDVDLAGSQGLSRNAELFELVSLDDPESLQLWVTIDRRTARLSVEAGFLPHARNAAVMGMVREIVSNFVPEDWSVVYTGTLPTNEAWVSEVQAIQMRSFPVAFVMVFLMASLFLRSLRLGLLAMIPTLLPLVVALGAMGWLDMGLDVGRSMVAVVVIGVGVDDAIHYLRAYQLSREGGADRFESARTAARSTGKALVTTSAALAIGFLTLGASAWQTISTFGFFVSLTIVAALGATLLVIPAVLCGPPRRRT
jgi:predicted RND superfamily exporter protein